MRLIDADALKNAIKNCTLTRLMNDEFDGIIIELIDNAPTVENITVFSEGADEETLEDIKKELTKVLDKLKERNNG